jgi:hypothetical protein
MSHSGLFRFRYVSSKKARRLPGGLFKGYLNSVSVAAEVSPLVIVTALEITTGIIITAIPVVVALLVVIGVLAIGLGVTALKALAVV